MQWLPAISLEVSSEMHRLMQVGNRGRSISHAFVRTGALLALCFMPRWSYADDASVIKLSGLQVDLVSRYIWRGFDATPDGNTPSLQPAITLNLPKSRLSFTTWSSIGLSGSVRRDETDYILT